MNVESEIRWKEYFYVIRWQQQKPKMQCKKPEIQRQMRNQIIVMNVRYSAALNSRLIFCLMQ